MTKAAREVLRDCEAALEDLQGPPTGLQWRTRWAGAVALLRAVGHVLARVDTQTSLKMKTAITDAFDDLKRARPAIFWEFIEEERNSVLKVYEFGAQQNVTVRPGVVHLTVSAGGRTLTPPASDPGHPPSYDHIMRGGPFAGRDPRDVVRDAIEWWRQYLDDVDRRAI